MLGTGILGKNGRQIDCPLLKVRVRAEITELITEVSVEQHYEYRGDGAVEIFYLFPLPQGGVITGFSATVGEARVNGVVMDREKAHDEYGKALRDGHSPLLLESHRENVFQVSLGRIKPHERVVVIMNYIELLTETDGDLRFVLPTVVAPRYIPQGAQLPKRGPGTAHPTIRVPDADYITPPLGEAPYELDFAADVALARPLTAVSSPSHPLRVVFDQQTSRTHIALGTTGEMLDRDLVIVLSIASSSGSFALVGAAPFTDYAYVHLNVPFAASEVDQRVANDYIFLLDTSGSMAGEKLAQAKLALRLCLRNMESGDNFNVIEFNSEWNCLSPQLLPYSQSALQMADAWIDTRTATGGTEIYEPLAHALTRSAREANRRRVLFLLTDGQVGNESELVELVRSKNDNLLVFTIGIDTAVNAAFIEALARAGNGAAECIYPGEAIDSRVVRHFARVHELCLLKAQLTTPRGKIIDTLPVLPSILFAGDTHTLIAQGTNLAVHKSFRLMGELGGQNYYEEIPVRTHASGRLFVLRWAQDRIRQIEKTIATVSEQKELILRREAVDLSIRHGILSSFTGMLAVHKRADGERSSVATVVVPVAQPARWVGPQFLALMSSAVPPLFSVKKGGACVFSSQLADTARESYDDTPQRIIKNLLLRQRFDGSFGEWESSPNITSRFVVALMCSGHDFASYRQQLRKAGKFLLSCPLVQVDVLVVLALKLLQKEGLLKGIATQQLLKDFTAKLSEREQQLLGVSDLSTACELLGVPKEEGALLGVLEALLSIVKDEMF